MELKLPKRKKVFKKGGLYASPDFFWGVLLLIALAMIVAAFVFGFLLFIQINNEGVSSVEYQGGESQAISKERIDKILEYFSIREEKSKEILNSPTPFIDPSL